jgi:hypothetical protein
MRRLVLLVPATLLALAASACGATDPVAAEEVSGAATKTASAGSFRVGIEGTDDGEPVVMSGLADFERHRAAFTYDQAPSDDEQLVGTELRAIGTTLYMDSAVLGVGGESPAKIKPWIKIEDFDDEASLDNLIFPFPFVEPGMILNAFELVSGSVESLGEETVRGVSTDHYRLTLDLARLIETAPAANRAALREELEKREAKTEPIEIWIDDAGRARRVQVTLDKDDLVAVDFYDFGVEVDVEAPPADQVDDIAELFRSDDTEVGGGKSEPDPLEEDG